MTVLKLAACILAFYLFLMYSPTLLDFTPKPYNVPLPKFEGALKENYDLNKAERMYEGLLHGPESVVFYKGDMYTGTEGGYIVKVKNGKVIPVAQTGRSCELPHEENSCGRPLGLRLGKDDLLYITDAYYGIFTMNFTTGALTKILSIDTEVDGRKMVFLDDMDIDDEGNLYISDASAKWDLSFIYYLVLEYENGGRIIKHNIHNGKTEVLLKNLYFPNGVQLSKDKKSLLISEISNRRILKYNLSRPKQGKTEVFIDNLPAEPDNIRPSPRGYWVALTLARNSTNPLLSDLLEPYPVIKRVLIRALHAISTAVMALADLAASNELKVFGYRLRRGDLFINFVPHHGMILELDDNGKLLRSLQSPDGKFCLFSEVKEHEGYLYLGSFMNKYLGRLKL